MRPCLSCALRGLAIIGGQASRATQTGREHRKVKQRAFRARWAVGYRGQALGLRDPWPAQGWPLVWPCQTSRASGARRYRNCLS